jgi:four helix bundle protein
MDVKNYRDLLIWRKAMDLMVECYKLSERLPKSETNGLVSEIRRSSTQVVSYIADGHERDYTNEFLRHLSAAHGQLMILETQWLAVDRLDYLPIKEIEPILNRCSEVGKMINGLMQNLRGCN